MLAVKGHYKNGRVELLNPIPNVKEAELYIVVIEKTNMVKSPEEEFEEIGLYHFFDTDDDKGVDWEDVFDVKNR